MQLTAKGLNQTTAEAVSFLTNSWVAAGNKRIFFTGQPSLPTRTPSGLVKHRQDELASLRVRTLSPQSGPMHVSMHPPLLVTYSY